MSTISTPRSSRGSSPANGGSPAILTPRRKIQALLAGIDSDSESEGDTNASRKVVPTLKTNASRHDTKDGEQSDDAEEDDIPQAPKGRLASRMQGFENGRPANENETAFDRVKRSLNERKEEQPTRVASASLSSSEDDFPVTKWKRRLMEHKQIEPTEDRSDSDRARSHSPLFCSPYKSNEKRPDPTPITRGSDRARSPSPLFCSPYKSNEKRSDPTPITVDSGDEEEVQQPKNARFLALVEKKRKEREAKEKEAAEKLRKRAEIAKTIDTEEVSDGSDDDMAGQKLTQSSKPTRKASKKALEAMNQETQRISRNMHLAHQATTKKKITKESFFARFSFGKNKSVENPGAALTSSTTGSSQPPSAGEEHTTPPTSPLRGPPDDTTKTTSAENKLPSLQPVIEDADDLDAENLTSLEELLANRTDAQQPEKKKEKPQERTFTPAAAPAATPKTINKPPVRIRVSRASIAEKQKNDSDSDLEVITSPGKCRRIAVFENLPVKKSQVSDSMVRLRALAHISAPSTRPGSSMTTGEMHMSLRKQARQQAMQERQEKIQELKDKGIYVDTAEERAKVEEDVEDLMEKARMEGEEISKREKQAAKKEGKEEPSAFDDEDDEDYVGEEDEVELSGSEDEEENEDETGDSKSQGDNVDLVDGQAGVAEESEDDSIEDDDIEDASEHHIATEPTSGRRGRLRRVVSDDEDEGPEAAPEEPLSQQSQSPKKPHFPDLQTTEEPSLGLTQAFAATFGDSQHDTEQDSLAALRSMPDPGLMSPRLLEPDSQEIVKDSQERPGEPIDLLAGYTQSDARVPASPGGAQLSTQYSEIPDPTQDAGFVLSPIDQRNRFRDAHATQDTVLLQNSDSPAVKKKGKLLRRGLAPEITEGDNGFTIKASAFDVLRKKAKKAPELFDKTKSEAKDIVDEAAEESEDEYAGLGGASDDGADEENEYDASMINDNSGEKVDEKQMAALNASHIREQDEKQVSKLLKDITTGAFRRKRGAADDLDLSDSDDEQLAARRRAKRREFNKMRKALLEDEKIGKIAENPKKLAFFRALEDRDPDDDLEDDFLEEPRSQEEASKEESASQDIQAGNGEETNGNNNRKRPLKPSAPDTTNRPPPSQRRGIASKKPATLAEIRESVSFLLEGPNAGQSKRGQLLSESEDSGDENSDANADGENGSKRQKTTERFPRLPPREEEEMENRAAPNQAAEFKAATSNGLASMTGTPGMAFHTKSSQDKVYDFTLASYATSGAMTEAMRNSGSNAPNTSSVNSKNVDLKTVRNSNGGEKKKGAVNYYTAARAQERRREVRMREKGERSKKLKNLLQAGPKGGLGALVRGGQWE